MTRATVSGEGGASGIEGTGAPDAATVTIHALDDGAFRTGRATVSLLVLVCEDSDCEGPDTGQERVTLRRS